MQDERMNFSPLYEDYTLHVHVYDFTSQHNYKYIYLLFMHTNQLSNYFLRQPDLLLTNPDINIIPMTLNLLVIDNCVCAIKQKYLPYYYYLDINK